MKKAILATKIGMTQIFAEDGTLVPVTVLEAGPNVVTQIKTVDNDGYEAVQVGYVDAVERAKSVDKSFIKTFGNLTIGVGIELDKEQVIDFTNQLNSLISSSVTTMSTHLGQLFGDLATGGDAWGNFEENAVNAMGDLAIALGKLAIESGLASDGIKAAINLGGGWVAIAAGAALVALGTAIKTGLSNISSGNYSSSSATASVASSSYSSSSSSQDWAESEVNVKVTGTLQANGSALVAVLNNEEKRKSHTT